MTFGAYVKDLREKCGLSLRRFCRLAGWDPSNWSKVERGILPPPKTRQQINDIATVLALTKESEAYHTLCDLAAISHLPGELVNANMISNSLPIFFRAARSENPSQRQIQDIWCSLALPSERAAAKKRKNRRPSAKG
jgi:transcriptional regulator with XRE-family HTH domain